MQSYAQHGDDLILLKLFQSLGITKPSYLDLGAGDPFRISNTALFYEIGCRGINVEANPDLLARLRHFRREDINLNCGIGLERGERLFYRVNRNPDLSSFDRKLAETNGECSPLMVEMRTVQDILDQCRGGIFPELLSIDIEGMDFAVLEQSINRSAGAPKVICAETIYYGDDHTSEFVELLASRGFALHCMAGANGIFVRADCG